MARAQSLEVLYNKRSSAMVQSVLSTAAGDKMSTVCKPVIQVIRGVRGGFDNRRLLFQSERMDIDLRLLPSGDAWTILGKAFGNDGCVPQQCTAELRDGDTALRKTAVNYMGEFVFTDVPDSVLVLELNFAGGRIQCGVEVG